MGKSAKIKLRVIPVGHTQTTSPKRWRSENVKVALGLVAEISWDFGCWCGPSCDRRFCVIDTSLQVPNKNRILRKNPCKKSEKPHHHYSFPISSHHHPRASTICRSRRLYFISYFSPPFISAYEYHAFPNAPHQEHSRRKDGEILVVYDSCCLIIAKGYGLVRIHMSCGRLPPDSKVHLEDRRLVLKCS